MAEGGWGMLRGMYKKMTSSQRREGERIMGLVVRPTAGGQQVTDITNPNVFPRLGRSREGRRGMKEAAE